MFKSDDPKAALLEETLLLGVLGRLIKAAPEKEWLQSLVNDDIFAESPMAHKNQDMADGFALLEAWTRQNAAGLSDEIVTDLTVDHTRLFVGVGQPLAPPWESVYFNEDRMIFQEQTLQVRQWYRRFGLEPEKLQQEPDDHIGLELSFLSYLASMGVKASEQGDKARLDGSLQAQQQFLREHPLKWVRAWSALVDKHARTDFYRGLAKVTRGVLLSLGEEFGVAGAETR